MFDDSLFHAADTELHDLEAGDSPAPGESNGEQESPDTVVAERAGARGAVDFTNLMTLYLRDVRRWPALDAQQEAALFTRITAGDTAARDDLICHHLGLVIAMARRFSNRGLELLDLIEEGNLALLVALDKFEVERGLRFSTYATWWIRYFLQTALAAQVPIVRPPLRVQKLARSGAWAQWQALHGEGSPEDAHPAPAAALVSSVPIHDPDAEALLIEAGRMEHDVSTVVSETRDSRLLNALVQRFLHDLPARQREVLVARFGLDGGDECTLADLARDKGVSRERMRQIQNTALDTLRASLLSVGITREAALS